MERESSETSITLEDNKSKVFVTLEMLEELTGMTKEGLLKELRIDDMNESGIPLHTLREKMLNYLDEVMSTLGPLS
jgi:hypothetical protein